MQTQRPYNHIPHHYLVQQNVRGITLHFGQAGVLVWWWDKLGLQVHGLEAKWKGHFGTAKWTPGCSCCYLVESSEIYPCLANSATCLLHQLISAMDCWRRTLLDRQCDVKVGLCNTKKLSPTWFKQRCSVDSHNSSCSSIITVSSPRSLHVSERDNAINCMLVMHVVTYSSFLRVKFILSIVVISVALSSLMWLHLRLYSSCVYSRVKMSCAYINIYHSLQAHKGWIVLQFFSNHHATIVSNYIVH